MKLTPGFDHDQLLHPQVPGSAALHPLGDVSLRGRGPRGELAGQSLEHRYTRHLSGFNKDQSYESFIVARTHNI